MNVSPPTCGLAYNPGHDGYDVPMAHVRLVNSGFKRAQVYKKKCTEAFAKVTPYKCRNALMQHRAVSQFPLGHAIVFRLGR